MSETKRLLKNTAFIAMGNIGVKMTSFLLLPLYTSILNQRDYGIYDYICSIVAFMLPIATLCMYEAIFRFLIDADSEEHRRTVFSNALLLCSISVMMSILLFIVAHSFFKFDYLWYYIVYIVSDSMYLFFNSALRGMGDMKFYAVFSFLKNLIQLVINIIAVAVLRLGVNGLLAALILSEFMGSAFIIFKIRVWQYIRIKYIKKSLLKEMFLYAIPLVPNGISSTILNISDRIIIKHYMGIESSGVYAISYKFPSIIEVVHHFFYTAWSESASRYLKNGKDKAEAYYSFLYSKFKSFIFSAILLMVAFMPIMFRVFINAKFAEGFSYIALLLFAMYFNCLNKFYVGICTAYKDTAIIAKVTVIAAVINVVINFLFIKQWGLYAASVSTLIAEIVRCEIQRRYLAKYITLNETKVFDYLAIVVGIAAICLYDYNNWYKTIISMIIAVIFATYSNREMIVIVNNKLVHKKQK